MLICHNFTKIKNFWKLLLFGMYSTRIRHIIHISYQEKNNFGQNNTFVKNNSSQKGWMSLCNVITSSVSSGNTDAISPISQYSGQLVCG